LKALVSAGGVLLAPADKARLEKVMWPNGKLSPVVTAQSAARIAELAGLDERCRGARFLMVEDAGTGPAHPFSGEKLSPVLTVYAAADFEAACRLVADIYAYQGAGHSVGIHTADDRRPTLLGLSLPVSRVIVNQAHCFATGGSFDNGLPFSLSMGCGTWGKNNFSDNMNYRHYMNITRIAVKIPPPHFTGPCPPTPPTNVCSPWSWTRNRWARLRATRSRNARSPFST
jgi:sulfoacetaldehyde dehydrogenase